MLILGIDPGLAKTGWGVLRSGSDSSGSSSGARPAYVDCGVLTTPATQPHIERLRTIGNALREVLAAHPPDLIAMERVFINRNYNVSLLLGEARGAALLTLLQAGTPLVELSALQIKQSITGKGRASKGQVALMLRHLLTDMPTDLPADSSDALACALAADAVHARRHTPLQIGKRSRHKRTLRAVAARCAV